jgi:hypothetical protein
MIHMGVAYNDAIDRAVFIYYLRIRQRVAAHTYAAIQGDVFSVQLEHQKACAHLRRSSAK